MKIDAVIPVYRPGAELRTLLERLERQTVSLNKIIIMNTRSVVDVETVAAEYDRTEVIPLDKENFDHGGTRDMGARASDADYILFMTQDAIPADTHLVESLYEAFDDDRVKAAYARQLPRKDCCELERYTRSFNYPDESRVKTAEDIPELGIKTFFCSNVCAMYDRQTYTERGGFIRHTIFNEDMIYVGGLIQAGYAVAYVSEARVYHSHNYSGAQQLRRNFDLAVSQADHPEIFADVKSESEGIRMVKQTAAHCVEIRKPWLVLSLVWSSGCKYLGYILGKNYRRMPRGLVLKLTMNRGYWIQKGQE